MDNVRNGEESRKLFETAYESRAAIIENAKTLRENAILFNLSFVALCLRYKFSTQKQFIITGGPNRIVPVDHDTVTLKRQPRGTESVDPAIDKIHLRIALANVVDGEGEVERDVPTNDVFIDIVNGDGSREFYLVNGAGFWVYDAVTDVVANPDGEITGNYFDVAEHVDQSRLTEEKFNSLTFALGLLRPDLEDNRSANI